MYVKLFNPLFEVNKCLEELSVLTDHMLAIKTASEESYVTYNHQKKKIVTRC